MLQACAQKRIGLLSTLVNLESVVSILCVCAFPYLFFVFPGVSTAAVVGNIVFVPGEKVGLSAAPSCSLAGGLTRGNR